jgi:hypothetical protein
MRQTWTRQIAAVSFVIVTAFGIASAQSLQSLTVEPIDPITQQPAGKLTFDHNGLVIEGVHPDNGQPFGKMLFSGNELTLIGFGDPPKVRLTGDSGGAVSFNKLRPDGGQEEVFLITGGLDEQDANSLGGQLKIFVRRRYADGDSAMRLMGVISAAYTADGQPRVRWHPNTVHDLESFTEPVYGVVTSFTPNNLTGTLSAIQAEDGSWLTAVQPNFDTNVSANLETDEDTTLRVQLRRTSAGGIPPYVYVYVNGVRVIDSYRPTTTSGEVVTAPMPGAGPKVIQVDVSAQTGTVEIGSILAQ